jgi:hypothetical protein
MENWKGLASIEHRNTQQPPQYGVRITTVVICKSVEGGAQALSKSTSPISLQVFVVLREESVT